MERRDFPGSRGCWRSLLPLGFVADGGTCKHDVHPHVCGLFWPNRGLLPPEASAQCIGGQRSDSNEPQFVHHAGWGQGDVGGLRTGVSRRLQKGSAEKSLCFSNFPQLSEAPLWWPISSSSVWWIHIFEGSVPLQGTSLHWYPKERRDLLHLSLNEVIWELPWWSNG